MSTIAYCNGVLACDTLIMDQGGFRTGNGPKIWTLKDGRLYGGVGSYGDILAVKKWVEEGEDLNHIPDIDEDFHGILVNKDKTFILIEDHLAMVHFDADYVALGSGKSVALGALANGADACQAVAAAITHDIASGGTVLSLMVANDGPGSKDGRPAECVGVD